METPYIKDISTRKEGVEDMIGYDEDSPSVLTANERQELARLWILEYRGLSMEEVVRRNALEAACLSGIPLSSGEERSG